MVCVARVLVFLVVARVCAAEFPLDLQFPNPTPDLPAEYSPCEPGAELLGFNLSFGGTPVQRTTPEFRVGIPTQMELWWVYRSASLRPQTVTLRWKGSAAEVVRRYPIDSASWTVGGAYRQRIDVDVPRFTHAGHGKLTIGLTCPDDPDRETVCYMGDSYTNQIVTTSNVPDALVRQTFGSDAIRLGGSFRLASGTRVPLRVTDTTPSACKGIGVLSALSHSHRFEQGEPVMRLRLTCADGGKSDVVVRAGEDTSLAEFDVPRPGTLDIERATVVRSRPHPRDRQTWDGRPLELHSYAGRLPLQAPCRPVAIEAEYLTDKGAIDVYDVVLLFE